VSGDVTFEELIERKRDGFEHTAEEIEAIIAGFSAGDVPDYQMAAWLMAVFLNGMTAAETVSMTLSMVHSGRQVDLSSIPGVKVDKHSTGGVADTTTLILAPLVAACGVPVAKMSGRGLGFTGGTLDKLEAIPGFRIQLSPEEFLEQVCTVGIAVIAQSPDVDPADKMIYALRDVTATVPSIPLIVGSIISKKIAGGADAILLDVKVGSGAFMKTEADACALVEELTRVGGELGREVVCVMTDMDQPLGMAVGNALEVREAIETLRGEGPEELTELCVALGAKMLVMGHVASDESEGRDRCVAALESGSALATFEQWIRAQGGDARVAHDTSLLALSPCSREIRATVSAYVSRFDAEAIGRAAMLCGAGRATVTDTVDPGAGLQLAVRVGSKVEPGTLLCTLYSSAEELLDGAESRFLDALHFSEKPVVPPPLFHQI